MYEITDMNSKGYGITRDADGAVVFVKGAVDKDVCEIEQTSAAKKYKTARVLSIAEASPFRCDPGCDIFDECGGCALRHITYEHELEIKRRSVLQAFRRMGISVDPGEVLHGAPEGYRNKAVFHRSAILGYYKHKSNDGIYPDSGHCSLIPQIFDDIREFSDFYSYANVNILELRVGDGGDICCAADISGDAETFADDLMKLFPKVVSVWDISDRSEYGLIRGTREIHVTLGGVRFTVVPSAFFQVNTAGAELLVSCVREFADLKDREKCADLYCGCGTFALTLAAAYPQARITGIELVGDAVDCAKRSAAWNGIENVRFYEGDAAAFADKLEGAETVIVDPPRAGLSKALVRQLTDLAPQKIVYVSCNPETLARDVASLGESYSIDCIRCVDMFPRTEHVECVVLMTRK